jgi:type II secretory pathway component PulM
MTDISPLSRHFGSRLEKLHQEIRASLKEVRRHLKELEEVEKSAGQAAPGQGFAELLRESLEKTDPPPRP